MEPSNKTTEPAKQTSSMVWLGVIVVILIVGFFGGMYFLRNSSDETKLSPGQSLAGSPAGSEADTGEPCPDGQHKAVLSVSGDQVVTCGTPANGKVTSVTSDSITITDSSDDSSKTYTVTSDTKIAKKGGVDVPLSDISVGESIGVIPNDDNTEAKRILADLPS
jgi:preprotein translocase subunit YajC